MADVGHRSRLMMFGSGMVDAHVRIDKTIDSPTRCNTEQHAAGQVQYWNVHPPYLPIRYSHLLMSPAPAHTGCSHVP